MNIFDMALEREAHMYKLYTELAEKAKSPGFKNIFMMMAKEEAKHVEIFRKKKDSLAEDDVRNYFVEAKELFEDLKAKEQIFLEEQDQLMLYCKIRDMEEENMKLYLQAAEAASNEELKKIYKEFAQEELQHYEMMEEIVQFVGRPLTWVSCAENSSLKVY